MYAHTIELKNAETGMKLAESVYVKNNSGTEMLAARKGAILDEKIIRVLETRGVEKIEILSAGEPEKVETIPVNAPKKIGKEISVLPKEIENESPVVSEKREEVAPIKTIITDKLKEEAVDSVKQLFTCFTHDGNLNKTTAYQCVSNVESVVEELLHVISDDATGLIHINDLKHYDEYTYHHSLSVSVLSMATGRELGFDADMLFRLGRCAMMHDIGKQMIPIEIINKKGKLTDNEFTIIKSHPVIGANNLKAAAIGDVELWNGIMFHHEKVNASGYPKGLKGADIPLFSKIISVADVYDAVTSYRSYRLPMLPSEAFELISRDVNISFELGVVKAFFSKLELYPVNTILELSDSRLGMVVDSEGASRLRPTVRIWGSTEYVDLAAKNNSDIKIVSVMNPEDLPDGYNFV
jgi:putative nucleotidyltransferase with HDIG domain